MPIHTTDSDTYSTFSGDGEAYSFNLNQLQGIVSEKVGMACTLRKLAEGGNHKVYDVLIPGEEIVTSVVRVASRDFPVDKLQSEVATLQHIAAYTSVRVPKVIAWDSDSANPAGAEYMIVEKIPGVPANEVWKALKIDAKERLMRDVAKSLLSLFRLRFSEAGSLYPTDEDSVRIGPLVTSPFYHAFDGEVRFPDAGPLDLAVFRGPFIRASEYLSSGPKAELYMIEQRREAVLQELDDDEERLNLGKRVLEKVVRLAEVYPGDITIGIRRSSPASQPFSLRLDDFRLPNLMVEEKSGKLEGLIDFEATTTAPLWMCAELPHWLDDIEGGDKKENEERAHLRQVFQDAIRQEGETGEEWMSLCEQGQWFREFGNMATYQVQVWASEEMNDWVDKRLEWASQFPGVGLPEKTLEEDIAERYGNVVSAKAA